MKRQPKHCISALLALLLANTFAVSPALHAQLAVPNQAAPSQTAPAQYPEISAQLDDLRPHLSSYPPSFANEFEQVSTQKRYAALKKQLDTLLSKQPENAELLYLRAELQQMGHHMDVEGAFDGAANDFQHLLAIEPAHQAGLIGFGQLLVNSNPANAPTAARLFADAQCVTPNQPLEEAHNGYFFALYYRGQMAGAIRQARFNQATWPSEQHQGLLDAAITAATRAGETVPTDAVAQLPDCPAR